MSFEFTNMTMDALIKQLDGKSKSEIKEQAFSAAVGISSFINDYVDAPDSEKMQLLGNVLVATLKAACGADGVFAKEEKDLVHDIVYVVTEDEDSTKAIMEVVDGTADNDVMEGIKSFVGQVALAGEDGRNCALGVAMLMLCFAAIDGRISFAEKEVVKEACADALDKIGAIVLLQALVGDDE